MQQINNKIKDPVSDKVFYFINNTLLILAFLIVIYPLIYIFSASFSDPSAVISGEVYLWPVRPTLKGYTAVFSDDSIVSGYVNTFLYTVVGTSINVFMTIIAAYPLSRRDFRGRNLLMFLFTFTMIFNAGLIPRYMLIRDLNLIDTFWVMVIPNAIGVYNLIVARTFYQNSISEELYEAASLDGCTHIKYLIKIVIPLSTALTAVLVLFYAVGHWNAYFDAMIYLNSQERFPLQLVLREILVENSVDMSNIVDEELLAAKSGLADLLRYSLIIVASLPVWCMYPFVQKHFLKGVMVGAIKG